MSHQDDLNTLLENDSQFRELVSNFVKAAYMKYQLVTGRKARKITIQFIGQNNEEDYMAVRSIERE